MATAQVHIRWLGEGLRFEASHPSNRSLLLDGNGKTAYSPVQTLLLSLAGCTAADVIEILDKMRVPISALDVAVHGDRNAGDPRYFKAIRLRYLARGVAADDKSKIERAIELSHEKYCSVLHSLRSDIDFKSELELL